MLLDNWVAMRERNGRWKVSEIPLKSVGLRTWGTMGCRIHGIIGNKVIEISRWGLIELWVMINLQNALITQSSTTFSVFSQIIVLSRFQLEDRIGLMREWTENPFGLKMPGLDMKGITRWWKNPGKLMFMICKEFMRPWEVFGTD